jgi:hypothetical protein
MSTLITKTIGIGGSHNYTTLAAWEADTTAFTGGAGTDLGISDTIAVGQCFFNGSSDGEFTGTGTLLHIVGYNTNSTNTITLTTGSGQSFRDAVGVRSNALAYHSANGVAITSSVTAGGGTLVIENRWVNISNLQVQNTGASGFALSYTPGAPVTVSVDDCIITSSGLNAAVSISQATCTLSNTLIYVTGATNTNRILVCDTNPTINMNYVTLVAATGSGPPAESILTDSSTAVITAKDCACFGATALSSGTGTFTYTNCMVDVTTPPTGCTQVTYANQFVSTTNDFRAKSGADLDNAGTSIGGITTDISGYPRNASTPSIGAWELSAGLTAVIIDAPMNMDSLAADITGVGSRTIWWRPN